MYVCLDSSKIPPRHFVALAQYSTKFRKFSLQKQQWACETVENLCFIVTSVLMSENLATCFIKVATLSDRGKILSVFNIFPVFCDLKILNVAEHIEKTSFYYWVVSHNSKFFPKPEDLKLHPTTILVHPLFLTTSKVSLCWEVNSLCKIKFLIF